MAKKKTILDFLKMKEAGEKFSKLAIYDFTSAWLAEQAGLEMILVGDSMGNVVYGYDGTVPVTMEQLIVHTQAVRRGAPNTFIVGDLPFLSYQTCVEDAVRNAGRFYKEAGVDAVKLEGGTQMAPQVRAIADAGMLVMAHIGLTPQSASALGGFRVQGNTAEGAVQVLKDAIALEEAGAFMVLLEGVPTETAKLVTEKLRVPTIGIGAGPYTDGQVLLLSDLLGMYPVFTPKFVKKYANMGEEVIKHVGDFVAEIKSGAFPSPEYCYKMKEGENERLAALLKEQGL